MGIVSREKGMVWRAGCLLVVTGLLGVVAAPRAGAGGGASIPAVGVTARVSVASDETQANNECFDPSISADGRYVAFTSYASNLVSGDTNGFRDIFVRDRLLGTTMRVSVASGNTQGNGPSSSPSISANGRFVAFDSAASNLVSGDTNDWPDVFVHDRVTGTTERVSVASNGAQGNGDSLSPSISADGRYVAFYSWAGNLVSGDTNGSPDVFVHDRVTGTTERVSVASAGTQGHGDSFSPSISADGRYVAFHSWASNLVWGDTNGWPDIFVHDRVTGTTERLSVASDGTEGNDGSTDLSISANGRYVAFQSAASNLVSGDTNGVEDIFVHDRVTGTTERVSINSSGAAGNRASDFPSISGDGRYVAFQSDAYNLVSGDTNPSVDIFVHDRVTGTTERASVASDGTEAGVSSISPSISADGRHVAFGSPDSNLVAADTNSEWDIFVRTLPPTAPANLTGALVWPGSARLTWTDRSSNETGFRILRSLSPSGPFAQVGTVGRNVTTFTQTGLAAERTYFYAVQASNRGYEGVAASEGSNVASVTTPPATPSGLRAIAPESDRVLLSWRDNSTSETGYEVERRIGTGLFALLASLPANSVSYEDATVSPNTAYSYRVRAMRGSVPSRYSSPSSVTTLVGPTGLTAAGQSAPAVDLAWQDNSGAEAGFEVQRRRLPTGSFVRLRVVGPNVTTYRDTVVTHGVGYEYRVRAIRSNSFSDFSNTVSVTVP